MITKCYEIWKIGINMKKLSYLSAECKFEAEVQYSIWYSCTKNMLQIHFVSFKHLKKYIDNVKNLWKSKGK